MGFANLNAILAMTCGQTAALAPIEAETPETKKACVFCLAKATNGSSLRNLKTRLFC